MVLKCGVIRLFTRLSVKDSYTQLRHILAPGRNFYRNTPARAMSNAPRLIVKPDGHLLMDEKLEITIAGLAKQQNTTVHAVTREWKAVFESCCCYRANDNGEVNLATQSSLGGSYTGVSPMGIFWSMVQAPGQREGVRLMKRDMDTPLTTSITIYDGHLTAGDIHNATSSAIYEGSVDRWYKGPGVKKQVVRHGRLRGILFLPEGDGPFPGVIDLFGTAGGILEFRSALLASRGFASLSLPYFRYEDLHDNLLDLDLEYFMEAIDWMCSHRDMLHDGIGVVGVSKGADIALHMATHSSKVTSVVCINGCTFLATYPMTYKGKVIPHVNLQVDKIYMKNGAIVTKDCFTYSEEDLTPAWESDAKFLNIVGEDDQCSPYYCIYFMKDHFPPEKKDNFEIVAYPGAGHLIEPPYTPLCSLSYHKTFDTKFLWGGQPEPHAFAQEDSWRRILDHLHKYIPKTSNCDLQKISRL